MSIWTSNINITFVVLAVFAADHPSRPQQRPSDCAQPGAIGASPKHIERNVEVDVGFVTSRFLSESETAPGESLQAFFSTVAVLPQSLLASKIPEVRQKSGVRPLQPPKPSRSTLASVTTGQATPCKTILRSVSNKLITPLLIAATRERSMLSTVLHVSTAYISIEIVSIHACEMEGRCQAWVWKLCLAFLNPPSLSRRCCFLLYVSIVVIVILSRLAFPIVKMWRRLL